MLRSGTNWVFLFSRQIKYCVHRTVSTNSTHQMHSFSLLIVKKHLLWFVKEPIKNRESEPLDKHWKCTGLMTRWEITGRPETFHGPQWVTEWPASISVTLCSQPLALSHTHTLAPLHWHLVSLCSTNTCIHKHTYTELDTRGGMFSRSGASNWIKPKPNAALFPRPPLPLP